MLDYFQIKKWKHIRWEMRFVNETGWIRRFDNLSNAERRDIYGFGY